MPNVPKDFHRKSRQGMYLSSGEVLIVIFVFLNSLDLRNISLVAYINL